MSSYKIVKIIVIGIHHLYSIICMKSLVLLWVSWMSNVVQSWIAVWFNKHARFHGQINIQWCMLSMVHIYISIQSTNCLSIADGRNLYASYTILRNKFVITTCNVNGLYWLMHGAFIINKLIHWDKRLHIDSWVHICISDEYSWQQAKSPPALTIVYETKYNSI